jgi:hypothetical protein
VRAHRRANGFRWADWLRRPGIYVWIAAGGLLVHASVATPLFRWYDRLLAWVLLCLFLEAMRTYAGHRGPVAPVLPLVMGQLYVMYGFAQFTQVAVRLVDGVYMPPPPAVTWAMLVVVAATVAFRLSFAWASHHGRRAAAWLLSRYAEPEPFWEPGLVVFGLVASVAVVTLSIWPEAIGPALRHGVHVVFSPYLALILSLHFAERRRSVTLVLISWLLIAGLWFSTLVSSMLEPGVVSLYVLFASRWMWRRQMRVRWLAVAIAGLLLLNPAKYGYRAEIFQSAEVSSVESLTGRLLGFRDQVSDVWGEAPGQENLQKSADRASALILLAQAVDWIPETVPYRHGEGLADSFLFIIPRALWEAKPDVSDLVNNIYAVDFRLTTVEGTQYTTIGIWQPIDGYWHFGVLGAIAGLGLYGLFLGWLFGRDDTRTAPALLGLYFTAEVFQVLMSLQNILASIPTMLLGAWIALHIAQFIGRMGSSVLRASRPRPDTLAASPVGTRRRLVCGNGRSP